MTDYASNWRNSPEGERISLGTATDEDKAVAVDAGADPGNVGLPPANDGINPDFVNYSGQDDDSSYTPPSPVSSVPDKYSPTPPTNVDPVTGGTYSPTYEPPAPVNDGINPDFVNYSGEDDSNYTPPSAPPDIWLTPAPSNEPISGGYTDFTDGKYIPPPADDSNYTPPSAPPDIWLTPAPSDDPISGGYTDFTNEGSSNYIPPPATGSYAKHINNKPAVNPFKSQKNTIKPVGRSVTDFAVGTNNTNPFFNTPPQETAPVYKGETNWAHKNTGSKYDSDPALRKISSQGIVDLVQDDRAGLYFPTSLEEARNILGDSNLTFSDTTTPFYNDKGEYMGILGESAFPYAIVVSEIAGEKPLLYFNTGGSKGGNKYIDYTGKTSWIDTPSAKTMSDQGTINDYILTSTSKNLDKPELTKDLSRKGINESWYDGIIGSAFDASNTGLGFGEALDESGNVDSNRMLEAFGTDDISKVIFGKPTLDLETERLIDIEANKPRDNVEYLTAAQKAELKDKWSNPGYQFYDENVQFAEYYNPSTGQYDTKPLNLQNQNQIRGYLGEDAIPYAIAHDYDESGNLLKDTYLFSTGKDADRIAKAQGKNIYTNVPTKYGQTDSLGFTMTDRELDSFDISKSLGLDYDTTTPEQRKNELLSGYYDPQFLIADPSTGQTFIGDNLDRMTAESEAEERLATQNAVQQNLTDSGYSLLVADEKGNVGVLSDDVLNEVAKNEYDSLISGKDTFVNYGTDKGGIRLSNTESLQVNPADIAQMFKSMGQVQLDEYNKSQQKDAVYSPYDMFIGASKSASTAINNFVETDMFKDIGGTIGGMFMMPSPYSIEGVSKSEILSGIEDDQRERGLSVSKGVVADFAGGLIGLPSFIDTGAKIAEKTVENVGTDAAINMIPGVVAYGVASTDRGIKAEPLRFGGESLGDLAFGGFIIKPLKVAAKNLNINLKTNVQASQMRGLAESEAITTGDFKHPILRVGDDTKSAYSSMVKAVTAVDDADVQTPVRNFEQIINTLDDLPKSKQQELATVISESGVEILGGAARQTMMVDSKTPASLKKSTSDIDMNAPNAETASIVGTKIARIYGVGSVIRYGDDMVGVIKYANSTIKTKKKRDYSRGGWISGETNVGFSFDPSTTKRVKYNKNQLPNKDITDISEVADSGTSVIVRDDIGNELWLYPTKNARDVLGDSFDLTSEFAEAAAKQSTKVTVTKRGKTIADINADENTYYAGQYRPTYLDQRGLSKLDVENFPAGMREEKVQQSIGTKNRSYAVRSFTSELNAQTTGQGLGDIRLVDMNNPDDAVRLGRSLVPGGKSEFFRTKQAPLTASYQPDLSEARVIEINPRGLGYDLGRIVGTMGNVVEDIKHPFSSKEIRDLKLQIKTDKASISANAKLPISEQKGRSQVLMVELNNAFKAQKQIDDIRGTNNSRYLKVTVDKIQQKLKEPVTSNLLNEVTAIANKGVLTFYKARDKSNILYKDAGGNRRVGTRNVSEFSKTAFGNKGLAPDSTETKHLIDTLGMTHAMQTRLIPEYSKTKFTEQRTGDVVKDALLKQKLQRKQKELQKKVDTGVESVFKSEYYQRKIKQALVNPDGRMGKMDADAAASFMGWLNKGIAGDPTYKDIKFGDNMGSWWDEDAVKTRLSSGKSSSSSTTTASPSSDIMLSTVVGLGLALPGGSSSTSLLVKPSASSKSLVKPSSSSKALVKP
ncbi:MAG: hypothetical protein PHV29_03155, partial [Candidatus Pacebacteria bacterium]|nr:hypothetical protein [Candidatus Paceibacterota bacterium]